MNFYSPLEQFEIFLLQPIFFFGRDISITSNFFTLLAVISAFISFFMFGIYKVNLIPNPCQIVVEQIYTFVLNIVEEQVGKKGVEFFPVIFAIFNMVAFSNLIGILPFGFTITSQIIFTFVIAFIVNASLFMIGLTHHGIMFFSLFIPSGIPKPLLPLVVGIEVISYFLRTISLSVRLFANMMAGHILLHILATFIVAIIKYNSFGWVLFVLPFIITLAVFCLELAIALLQAYVFTVLICIYLKEVLELHLVNI